MEFIIPEKFNGKVKFDFKSDINDLATSELKNLGYKVEDTEYNVLRYLNVLKRIVEPVPRNVYVSSELNCPNDYKDAFDELCSKLLMGVSVIPYMSKSIEKVDWKDYLLFDWNIQHFHLSLLSSNKKFVKRSDYLLFAFFDDNNAYLLQIYPHNKDSVFAQKEMIEIIENNWPDLLEKNRLNGVVKMQFQINDKERAKLRKNHINTMVETDSGNVYCGIGGIASSGDYVFSVMQSDKWNNLVARYEICFKRNLNTIINTLAKNKIDFRFEFKLLAFTDKSFVCYETETRSVVCINVSTHKMTIYDPIEFIMSLKNKRVIPPSL